MKMGYILILLGIIMAVIGVVMVIKSSKSLDRHVIVENVARQQIEEKPETEIPSSTHEADSIHELTAKEKGNLFEAYVADILKNTGIRIKEWNQGILTSNGAMGENTLKPDFYVEQPYGKSHITYWLECKWRHDIKGKISFPPSQFDRYKKTQHDSKRKVLIVFGIGGDPKKPSSIYIIPLDSINDYSVTRESLRPYYYSDPTSQLVPRISKYFKEDVFKR